MREPPKPARVSDQIRAGGMAVSGVRVPVENVADTTHRWDCCEAFQAGQHPWLGQGCFGYLNRWQFAGVVDALDPVGFPEWIGGPVFDMDRSSQRESCGISQIIFHEVVSPERTVIAVVAERFCRAFEPWI